MKAHMLLLCSLPLFSLPHDRSLQLAYDFIAELNSLIFKFSIEMWVLILLSTLLNFGVIFSVIYYLFL